MLFSISIKYKDRNTNFCTRTKYIKYKQYWSESYINNSNTTKGRDKVYFCTRNYLSIISYAVVSNDKYIRKSALYKKRFKSSNSYLAVNK